LARTVEELGKKIMRLWRVQKRPALKGPPGVGKTFLYRALARQLGGKFYTIQGSQTADPSDVNGFVVKEERAITDGEGKKRFITTFAARDWMYELNENGGVILIDEITSANSLVRASFLNAIQFMRFGDFTMDPRKVALGVAYNPAELAENGQEMGPASGSRMIHLDFPVNTDTALEWADNVTTNWGQPFDYDFMGQSVSETALIRGRAIVAGFIRSKPESWYNLPKDNAMRGEHGWENARSWEAVGDIFGLAFDEHRSVDSDLDLVEGAVGPGSALEVVTYARELDIPNPEDVLANPSGWKPFGRVDKDFTVTSSVAAVIESRPTLERYIAGWEVLNKAVTYRVGNNPPAYEAGTAAASRMIKLLKPSSEFMKSLDIKGKQKLKSSCEKLMVPFGKLLQAMGAIISEAT